MFGYIIIGIFIIAIVYLVFMENKKESLNKNIQTICSDAKNVDKKIVDSLFTDEEKNKIFRRQIIYVYGF